MRVDAPYAAWVLTSDFLTAVTNRVRHTGLPLAGQTLPFIRTMNPRQGNGGRNNNTLKFLFL